MSTNGFNPNGDTINGLNTINADTIQSTTISCDTFLDQPSNYFTNVSSNLQTQINTINSLVSTGSTGGGYFSLVGSSANGYVLANPYWAMGGGGVSTANVPLVNAFDFKVNSITFISQTAPTTSATVLLYKNGTTVYTMPIGTSTNITFSNMNVIFLAGDSISLYTSAGAGGTTVRATISCSVGGITGATPNLTVGTVSNLSSGSTPTVSISGTTLNPVLNFGLVQGIPGPVGPQGNQGPQGSQGPKGDTGDPLDPATLAGLMAEAGTAGAVAGATAGAETASSLYEERVATLEEKTTLIQSDALTEITSEGDVNIGAVGTKVSISGTSGNISTTGSISLGVAGTTVSLDPSGSITGDSINMNSAIVQDLSTTTAGNQYIYGSSILIGNPTNTSTVMISGNITVGQVGITTTSLNGLVYVNGVLLLPWSFG